MAKRIRKRMAKGIRKGNGKREWQKGMAKRNGKREWQKGMAKSIEKRTNLFKVILFIYNK